jgi:hypothetical protein
MADCNMKLKIAGRCEYFYVTPAASFYQQYIMAALDLGQAGTIQMVDRSN